MFIFMIIRYIMLFLHIMYLFIVCYIWPIDQNCKFTAHEGITGLRLGGQPVDWSRSCPEGHAKEGCEPPFGTMLTYHAGFDGGLGLD